jgi:hypothetical protein
VEIYEYVYYESSGIIGPAATISTKPSEFATCLIRNEGVSALYNVDLNFVYRENNPFVKPFPGTPRVSKIRVPHVGKGRTYINIENMEHALVEVYPGYDCKAQMPDLTWRLCSLPPGQFATRDVLQGPSIMNPVGNIMGTPAAKP